MVVIYWDILLMAVEKLLHSPTTPTTPQIDFQVLSLIGNTGPDIVLMLIVLIREG